MPKKENRNSKRNALWPPVAAGVMFGLVGVLAILKPFQYSTAASVNRHGQSFGQDSPTSTCAYGWAFLVIAVFFFALAYRIARW